jgi:hypothetical protein
MAVRNQLLNLEEDPPKFQEFAVVSDAIDVHAATQNSETPAYAQQAGSQGFSCGGKSIRIRRRTISAVRLLSYWSRLREAAGGTRLFRGLLCL